MNNIEVFTEKCKSVIKLQRDMTKFLRKHEGRWHSFAPDRETVEVVCALSNLGILEIRGDQMILKSREKADRFITSSK